MTTTNARSALFNFAPFIERREDTLELIRQFAAHPEYRSAVVDELELDEDYYRRPLRPEDLGFLKFDRAVRADVASQLPALAANRLLLSINELDVACLPRGNDAGDRVRFAQFYGDDNRVLGSRIRPFLENHSFEYLCEPDAFVVDVGATAQHLHALYQDEFTFWTGVLDRLQKSGYLREGLRFISIQTYCLLPSKRTALARAAAAGYFDLLAPCDRPSLGSSDEDDAAAAVAKVGEVTRRAHSYWQFYLPTSLMQTNLLYALATRPDRAFALVGAAFAAEAKALAYNAAILQACPHRVAAIGGGKPEDSAKRSADLLARFERALTAIEAQYGPDGVARAAQGLATAINAAASGRRDLGDHIQWLTSIDEYCAFAQRIHARILAECPDIDRETFVEPREMCSTTHVHDDHRLVVIETGDMVFWGNLGMQLKMKPGDMVLIPCGRLHGSTVVSDECVYHQPIIPEAWIADLRSERDARPAVAA